MHRNTPSFEMIPNLYAEIYSLKDHGSVQENTKKFTKLKSSQSTQIQLGEWMSPSDIMFGKVQLRPPFTTRYMRGETQQGILAIGDTVLELERKAFLELMKTLLSENDKTWQYILYQEKENVKCKAIKAEKAIYEDKSKIMFDEFGKFYESTLQELENHMRCELEELLLTTHSEEVSRMNILIKQNLDLERQKMEDELQEIYQAETKKLRIYYYLLMKDKIASTKIIDKAIQERDDAIAALFKQMESQNLTGSMYVMCTERKKCRVKNFLLESYCASIEAEEVKKKIEKGKQILDIQAKYVRPDVLNKQWQEKTSKILKIFLKFISYTLKLLPEQTTFLLDFERMVVMQLNEILKEPGSTNSILVDSKDIDNLMKFFKDDHESAQDTDKKPFVIFGDFTKPEEVQYGSRETIPLDVDLPVIVMNRDYVYAQCNRFEDIKYTLQCKCKKLRAICRCGQDTISSSSTISSCDESEALLAESVSGKKSKTDELNDEIMPTELLNPTIKVPDERSSESSLQSSVGMILPGVDFLRIDYCPCKKCGHWLGLIPAEDMSAYFEFDENIFKQLKSELALKRVEKPKLQTFVNDTMNAERLPLPKLPQRFYKSTEVQCLLDELFDDEDCPCCKSESKEVQPPVFNAGVAKVEPKTSKDVIDEFVKRRIESIQSLFNINPSLLRLFTYENFSLHN